jgi:hypothetical protein
LTISAGVETGVNLDARPGSTCNLHAEGSPAAEGLPLYADPRGFVRVHLRPNPEESVRLALDCERDGALVTTVYDVKAGAPGEVPSGAAVARADEALPIRPALTGDPMAPSNAEIVGRGYPPRPDPVKAPEAYARWLDVVSKPARVLPAITAPHTTVDRPARPGGAVTSPITWRPSKNRCGYAVDHPAGVYDYVEGIWDVPTVIPRPSSVGGPSYVDYSSEWIGLDGYRSSDIVRAGTEQDTQTISGVGAASYSAWTENDPAPGVAALISVNPGDSVYVFVWVGDANADVTPSGQYAWYYLLNTTQGTLSYTSSVLAAPFAGSSAEWIVEAPGLPASSSGLANFRATKMEFAQAFDPTWGAHDIVTDPALQLDMYNAGTLLCKTSSASTTSPPTIDYAWVDYD